MMDTEIIAKSPVRLTVAGMGDALATYFEARACQRSEATSCAGGNTTGAAMALAELCFDTLMEEGVKAKIALEAGVCTPAVEKIIEANTLLSGIGFESAGLAGAHAIHNGLTVLEECHHMYHGEKVAFGTLAQLVLENVPHEELEEIIMWCIEVGLPVTLEELGAGNKKPEILSKLAQYELTLKDWVEAHRGYRKYVTLTGKCWPAFQTQFGFVPCYVNSRLTAQGIPVSCEVDIYGTLSEFIGTVVSQDTVTLLDINNSVPKDMYKESIEGKFDYTLKDTFMGFHCGNTASSKLSFCEMKYQMIMARSLPVEVTNGTLEGDIVPGDITFYRLQSTADNKLRGYIAHGEVLPVATKSFGAIGVFAIPEMGRFYRHVLIEGGYPHHGAVAFGHYGKALFEVFKYIGVPVEEIGYNQPAGVRYPTENPWG